MTEEEYCKAINDIDRVINIKHPLITVAIRDRARNLRYKMEAAHQEKWDKELEPFILSRLALLEELEDRYK